MLKIYDSKFHLQNGNYLTNALILLNDANELYSTLAGKALLRYAIAN